MYQAGHGNGDLHVAITPAELDLRYGDRIELMLAHWLDDEQLAARLRPPVLSALASRLQTYPPGQANLEDWVFGEARREAREFVPPDRIPGVIPVMRGSSEDHDSFEDAEDWDEHPTRWRLSVPPRWIWFGAFMVLMLSAIGYASLNVSQNGYRDVAPVQRVPVAEIMPAVPQEPRIRPAPDLPILDAQADSAPLPAPRFPVRLQALEAPAPLPPDPAQLMADLPRPPEPPAPRASGTPDDELLRVEVVPQPVEPTVPAELPGLPSEPRVFIHYSGVDGVSAERAERLATLLRARNYPLVAIRRVPFQIGQPSVRYFFEENRADANQLVQLSSRILPPYLRGAYGRPADFTHFSPKPQPGTLEIWLPTG
ncbi:MAG TPA: hypothetical protein VHL31_25045 [Geminicoccus sp.]|jgi:hypothetical protein|uniref:hypothetical protein n=1 Tax=Geminicoccus sp. TaxID=2024832 RepID=UPI002E31994A|nr:hypothetical protein [Geminicoccus sp.]HEX2529549.1 hypothetical protein [Geminicoccus sp.]